MDIFIKDYELSVYVPKVEVEEIDDEIAIYFVEEEKIAVLNSTATVIWKEIIDAMKDGRKTITIAEVFETFKSKVNIADVDLQKVESDINDVIVQFIEEHIFIKCGE